MLEQEIMQIAPFEIFPHNVIYLDIETDLTCDKVWLIGLLVHDEVVQLYADNWNEEIFINDLIDNTEKGIILSWAHEGQPGPGHLNCRNSKYLLEKFAERGLAFDATSTKKLRESTSPHTYWLSENLLVFRKSPKKEQKNNA